MRPTQLAATLAALLLAAPLVVAESRTFQDAAGDESLVLTGRTDATIAGFEAGECHAPAADIRALEFTSTDESIVLTLTLASLGGLGLECAFGLDTRAAVAGYAVSWIEPVDDIGLVVFPFAVRASAESTGFGIEGCVRLDQSDPNGALVDCLADATVAIVGDSIVWTLPIAGTHVVEVCEEASCLLVHEEERAFDLRGFEGELGADARVQLVDELTGLSRLVAYSDDIDAAVVRA